MASVWERRHGVVYSRAEDLFSLCQQPGIPDATLGAVLGGMVNAFVGKCLITQVDVYLKLLSRGIS